MTRHRSEEERRTQILGAARKAFIRRGYFSTSVEDIADVAGLSKGGIYFRFKAKGDIMKSIVDGEYGQSMTFFKSIVNSTDTARQKIELLTTFFVQAFVSDKDSPRFSLVRTECALRDDKLRRALLKMQRQYIDSMVTILEAGVASGEFRKVDMEPTAIVLKAIMDGIEGALALGLEVDPTRLVKAGLELVVHGLGVETDSEAKVTAKR
ncbi:MAG: TetR/AcrR family transcriptional regulator [Deltaproteobacteria bacterium]|nr:TetR/AcrR family transcriptional regulator [Deltaproteobacteria bacterium]